MAERIFLVQCVSTKQSRRVAAKDLYTSALFTKSRAYVEKLGGAWYILSAEHGLLDPEAPTDPYDKTLKNMPVRERRAWAEMVIGQMEERLPDAQEVVLLAGIRYQEGLVGWLRGRYPRVSDPMAGLGFGQRMQWLDKQGGG